MSLWNVSNNRKWYSSAKVIAWLPVPSFVETESPGDWTSGGEVEGKA
jgi:hypothetical protein